MDLEFKVYELKEDSGIYKMAVVDAKKPNEFIIVGEELVGGKLDCYKVQQLEDQGIKLLGGMKIDEAAYSIEKNQLKLKGDDISFESTEIDIPRKYLTMKIIETIQRLNK